MERDGTERAMEGRPHDTAVRTPPRTSRAISTFAWDDAFATTALPDLTFSFQPKPLRLVRASGLSLPVEEREEDVEEEGTESCVLDDEDPFELEMGPDRDDGSEGASEEELDDMGDCQIIGARREHIGRLVELEQEEDDCDAHERRDGPIDDVPSPHAQVDCDSSRHTSEESEDRDLGIEPDLRCNSRIVQSMDFPAPPTSAAPESPPRHDVTGRPLPSSPPTTLPFAFDLQTPPRSPRFRFSIPIARSPDSRVTKEETSSTATYWDTTIELDSMTSPLPARPKSARLAPPSPTSLSPSSPERSLPAIPPMTSPRESALQRQQSLATRRTGPLPLPFLETPPVASTSPGPRSPTSPLRSITRSTSGFYRLPPSPLNSAGDTPDGFPFPLPPPLSASASTPSFTLPPSHSSANNSTPSTAQTRPNSSDALPKSSPPSASLSKPLPPILDPPAVVPRFVSILFKDHEDPEDHEVLSDSRAPSPLGHPGSSIAHRFAPESNGRHRRTTTLRHRPHSLANARTEVSIGGSSSKTLVDDKAGPGQVEKWLKHVAEESEGKERRTVVEWRSRGEADGLRRAREGRLSRLKRFARTKRGRWTLGVLGALVSITVLIVAAVASSRKKEDGKVELWLNSTCLALGGNSIAQAFLDVAERASSTWSPSIDPSRLAYTLNHYVYRSNPSTSVCASQVALLSFPSLARHPNRLSFAQSALVHTLALSESNATTFRFHTFISSLALPAELGDDRAKRRNSNFQIMSGGFVWDFGTMERIVSSRTWRDVTRPSEDETRRMNGRTRGLDRIVPYAFASSAQRGRALRNYWTDDLGMDEDDLERFRQVVRESPVLVPISREEERTVRARIDNEDDAVEVVQGIGCREGLSPEVRNRVNDIENGVFGLDSISISNSNQTCANRPTYGIVNLFHLASPFPSSITLERPRLPLGSLVLSQNISARSTLNAGEALSAGPSSLPLRPLTSPLPSPFAPFTVERFGLFDQFDHVILEYLASMETETAQLVARFLLSRPTSPPSSTSPLSRRSEGLASLPLLEVQVWGGVRWNDVEELRSAG